ncbi:MAG: alkaline phosphatase family protein [Bdellovibrionales bacterium]|nr:alkaline phosphatase family protein [Bdellovibrionales bacterium]
MHKLLPVLPFLVTGFVSPSAHAKISEANKVTPPYKLGVVIVIDQFRADYLMRYKFSGGFKFLKDGGAYMPLADHGLLQDMTGPGHAAIMSGTFPYRHGISTNYWFNRDKNAVEYCTQDDDRKTIGSGGVVAGAQGMSPKLFNGTTLGDELKNVDRSSRSVSIAVKDRAAILMAGKRADQVYWLDYKNCQWVTSDFYMKEIPGYVKKLNADLTDMKTKKYSWGPYKNMTYCNPESLRTSWIGKESLKLALAAVDDLKLGKGPDTDLLTVSLSSHDYLGHQLGPNSESLLEMSQDEDKMIGEFIQEIGKRVGMNNVFFVLTGDHGTPPSSGAVPKEKLANENIKEEEVTDLIENSLTKEYGKPKGGKWIASIIEFQLYLNQEALKNAKVTVADVGHFLRPILVRERYIDQLLIRDEILYDRKVPPGDFGKVIDHTLSRHSGDLLMILNPYYWSDSYPLTHMTHYSYDRYVPLVIWGKTFKPGTYRAVVNVVDLAPTLASVLNVLPPSQAEGRVMTEILR